MTIENLADMAAKALAMVLTLAIIIGFVYAVTAVDERVHGKPVAVRGSR